MFGRMVKIAYFSLVAAGLYLISATPVAAQKIEFEAKSAADFAKGTEYENVLRDREAGNNTTLCGSADNVCSPEQACLKCASINNVDEVLFGQTGHIVKEVGKCVAKSSLDMTNLIASWPECTEQNIQRDGWLVDSSWIRTLSLEANGFLAADQHKELGITWSKKKHSFKGTDGKEYNLYISDKPTIVYGNNDGNKAFRGCEILPVKIYNHQKCFFCPLSAVIFSAANSVTKKSFEVFASSFAILVVVVFAIWLAFTALAQAFPMTKQDAPKFLSSILKQGFKVALVFFLLQYSSDLFRGFIIPVLDGGLTMGTEIKAVDMPQPDSWIPTASTMPIEESYFNLPISGQKIKHGEMKEAVSDTLYLRIETFLASVQSQLSYMQAIGTTLFCVGGHTIITLSFSEFKDGLRMMFLGGVLTAFSFLLTFAFAFYFLDGLLQLAVLGAMLPLMIAGWPLKATAQYATTGFKMLLNTFFVMFFTGFVISVNVVLINESLSFAQKEDKSTGAIAYTQENAEGFQAITDAMNNQNLDNLKKATDIGGTGFLLLAFSCIFGFKFVSQVSPLAGTLSSGGFKGGLASKVGTMGVSFAKGAADKAISPVTSGFREATGGIRGIAARVGGGITGGIVSGVGKGLSKAGAKRIGGGIQKFGGGISKFGKKIQDVHKQKARSDADKRWG